MTSDIGARFKEIREKRQVTQPAVGKICGVSKQTVIRWEQGQNSIPSDALGILEGHGFDVLYILTGHKNVTAVADLKSEAPAPYLVRGRGAPPEGDELMDTLELLRDTASRAIELLKKERGGG